MTLAYLLYESKHHLKTCTLKQPAMFIKCVSTRQKGINHSPDVTMNSLLIVSFKKSSVSRDKNLNVNRILLKHIALFIGKEDRLKIKGKSSLVLFLHYRFTE